MWGGGDGLRVFSFPRLGPGQAIVSRDSDVINEVISHLLRHCHERLGKQQQLVSVPL